MCDGKICTCWKNMLLNLNDLELAGFFAVVVTRSALDLLFKDLSEQPSLVPKNMYAQHSCHGSGAPFISMPCLILSMNTQA
jgi:hypothetical protein